MIRDVTIDVSPRFSYDRRIEDKLQSLPQSLGPDMPAGYRLMLVDNVVHLHGYSPHVRALLDVRKDTDAILRADDGEWMRPHERERSGVHEDRLIWRLSHVRRLCVAIAVGEMVLLSIEHERLP